MPSIEQSLIPSAETIAHEKVLKAVEEFKNALKQIGIEYWENAIVGMNLTPFNANLIQYNLKNISHGSPYELGAYISTTNYYKSEIRLKEDGYYI